MFPNLAINNQGNMTLGDSEYIGDFVLRDSLSVHGSNFPDGLPREFCDRGSLSSKFPSLHNMILDVFRLRTYPKMFWIHAGRVVATVKNALPRWNISNVDFVREPVSVKLPESAPAVSGFKSLAIPNPATGFSSGFIDLLPEAHWSLGYSLFSNPFFKMTVVAKMVRSIYHRAVLSWGDFRSAIIASGGKALACHG